MSFRLDLFRPSCPFTEIKSSWFLFSVAVMIRERPRPPGTMDSTTVKEVNSYCANIGALLRDRNALVNKSIKKLEVSMLRVMRRLVLINVEAKILKPKNCAGFYRKGNKYDLKEAVVPAIFRLLRVRCGLFSKSKVCMSSVKYL